MNLRPGPLGYQFDWPQRPWRWAWAGAGIALVAACSAVWVPRGSDHGAADATGRRAAAAPAAAAAPVQASGGEAVDLPFLRSVDDGPEARLIKAYAELGRGDGRAAFEHAAALVADHPDFLLAQLLYGDLLAARAGFPAAFGVDVTRGSDTHDPARLALREEAQRRLAALRERPPAGRLPAEFVKLAPSVRHAVAVDASRSRLYLFDNGPDGLKLVRDFYVSLGKLGVDKHVEGDRRTPLGVYWITAALPKRKLDDRFGHGALRFNYPNALDKIEGRTGSGLFLHGVSSDAMNRAPFATDGCVAMANTDVERLMETLTVDATPVVIARRLRWVTPEETRQAAAEFEPAWQAWSLARREADAKELASWYTPEAAGAQRWVPGDEDRAQLSLLAWHSDGAPTMVVTSHPAEAGSTPSMFRQYWMRRNNRWRIAFEDAVVGDGSLGAVMGAASR